MGFSAQREQKTALRRRGSLRASLHRMASALDSSGQTTAPITLPCTFVDLCKLGLVPHGQGQFVFQSHPVRAAQGAA